jgi:transposase
MVHVSETCEPTAPHLITHVHTTAATVHEAQCTIPIHAALIQKALAPVEPLVDAAYIDAALLVESQEQYGITLRGPTRPPQRWQAQVEGGYTIDQFEVDWAQQRGRCPQGQWSGTPGAD